MSNAPQLHGRQSEVAPSALNGTAGYSTNSHYTVIIRCPFPRGDFIDPPLIEWDATKDRALWKVISRTSEAKELDCKLSGANELWTSNELMEA